MKREREKVRAAMLWIAFHRVPSAHTHSLGAARNTPYALYVASPVSGTRKSAAPYPSLLPPNRFG